jgi:DNA-binding response OmpR family regulator
MDRSLAGRSILIVEDEPLIALDIETAFVRAGARVITTNRLAKAVDLVEQDGLSAAVLDHALGDGNSSHLCERLQKRGIPFVIYSGFAEREGACHHAPHVSKPASPEVLVTTVVGLLGGRPSAD